MAKILTARRRWCYRVWSHGEMFSYPPTQVRILKARWSEPPHHASSYSTMHYNVYKSPGHIAHRLRVQPLTSSIEIDFPLVPSETCCLFGERAQSTSKGVPFVSTRVNRSDIRTFILKCTKKERKLTSQRERDIIYNLEMII